MKISVITPSYNSGRFIRQAIESVLAQQYTPFEHIIVDGASTDGTLSILKDYPHLTVVSEPDKGQSDAMNKGFRLSSGDIIVYLNADDILLPSAFRTVLPYFDKGADFVVGNVLVQNSDGSIWLNAPKTQHLDMLRHWEPNAFCVNPVGYYYRRSIQEKVGGFNHDNKYAMDLEFLLEASRVCELVKIKEREPLGKFILHDDCKTLSQEANSRELWTPDNFSFLDRYIDGLSLTQQEAYRQAQLAGYESRRGSQKINTLPSPKGVSLVICTYNGARLLKDTIPYILRQEVPDNIPWEFILVNNASTDLSANVVSELWSGRVPLKIVDEPTPGLVHARQKGISEARYEYISFIDDDNWIEPSWVKTVYDIFDSHPDVGICGGQSSAVHEAKAPAWFASVQGAFAVGQQAESTGDITATRSHVWGAGLSLRKSAYHQIIQSGFSHLLTGRKGKQLLAGEDTELCYAFILSGWRIWYSADLKLQHFLPSARVKWDYVERLYQGFGASHAVFDLYRYKMNGSRRNHKKARKKAYKKLVAWLWWRARNPFIEREGNLQYLQYLLHLARCRFIFNSGKDYKRYYKQISKFAEASKHQGR